MLNKKHMHILLIYLLFLLSAQIWFSYSGPFVSGVLDELSEEGFTQSTEHRTFRIGDIYASSWSENPPCFKPDRCVEPTRIKG